ncbi:MAG: YciI family protein [Pyrinomonadaceae bacterium]
MKNTYSILQLALIVVLVSATSYSQTTQAPASNPNYDAALAAKLGADERGMKMYVMCFLKTGPLKVDDPNKRSELMKGHFGMINRLATEGKLILAGPFSEGGDFRGIYLFDVKTIEEAQKLTETDPSIKEGYFKVEFIKWYGSAALMEVNGTHKKIAKVGI